MKNRIMCFIFVFSFLITKAQEVQDKKQEEEREVYAPKELGFDYKQLIIPTVLISYGIIGLGNDRIKYYNSEIKDKLREHAHSRMTIDNFTQYTPALSVYALNLFGVEGKHNLRDRTIILTTSFIFVGVTVTGLKYLTKVDRPDGSSNNSFPSGHTAIAFVGAEFLWQEYKDISIWYGVSGFAVATGTGFLRIYNNRHWFTDVVAGAGLGILCAKSAYWLHPFIEKKIFNREKSNVHSMLIPFYNGRETGLSLAMIF